MKSFSRSHEDKDDEEGRKSWQIALNRGIKLLSSSSSSSSLSLSSCLLLLLGNSLPLYQTAFPPHGNKESRRVFILPNLQKNASWEFLKTWKIEAAELGDQEVDTFSPSLPCNRDKSNWKPIAWQEKEKNLRNKIHLICSVIILKKQQSGEPWVDRNVGPVTSFPS